MSSKENTIGVFCIQTTLFWKVANISKTFDLFCHFHAFYMTGKLVSRQYIPKFCRFFQELK